MKRTVFVIAFLFFTGTLGAQSLSKSLVFDERVYNFGAILEEKGKVSHTFTFTNTGSSSVEISDVNSACGCIGNVVTKGPVKPGGKGSIKITFDPAYKSGFFSKEIVVLSNNNTEYNRIWVEGTITPAQHPISDHYPYDFGNGLHMRLKVLAYGYMNPGETKELELHYANDTDKEMDLRLVPNAHAERVKFTAKNKLDPKERGVMKVMFTMPQNAGDEVIVPVDVFVNGKKLRHSLALRIIHARKLNRITPKPVR